jgi:hypothetical protein
VDRALRLVFAGVAVWVVALAVLALVAWWSGYA